MIDNRLKGTKCEKCMESHYFILEDTQYTKCADCIDRPNRSSDKSRFTEDVKKQETKDYLDEIGRIGTAADY